MKEAEASPRSTPVSTTSKVFEAIAQHWSKPRTRTDSKGRAIKVRWWQHPPIIRHINANVCGKPVDGFSAGLTMRARSLLEGRLPLVRGISVGCGNGRKEMTLLQEGLVEQFDLYELAPARIATGRELARRYHLTERAHFIEGDAFQLVTRPEQYDLVHWNNSLHHMLDVEMAVEWSWHMLRDGGMFYMDDFVGPSRFQWPEEMLLVATAVRQSLPDRLLIDPANPERILPRIVKKPEEAKLRQVDPSEAADSSRILDCVRRRFPEAEIVLTGGVIYHLALSGVLANFDAEEDSSLLERLLELDDLCTAKGDTHYATALALKI